jgi:2,4-dienoyl-CoA reductase-like NADH-dependent reductase (Old Yellow Enzyme family)
VSVPSQTGGFPSLSATKAPLPGRHMLFGQDNSEEEYVEGEAMTEADIERVKAEFVQAAGNAISAGFDGVEIHGM